MVSGPDIYSYAHCASASAAGDRLGFDADIQTIVKTVYTGDILAI